MTHWRIRALGDILRTTSRAFYLELMSYLIASLSLVPIMVHWAGVGRRGGWDGVDV